MNKISYFHPRLLMIGLMLISSCSLNGKIQGLDSANSNKSTNLLTVNTIDDGSFSPGLSKSTTAQWSTLSDPNISYQIAVGTTAGGTDIVNWMNVGSVSQYSLTNLNLSSGTTYYTSIRTVDKSGALGPITSGDGWQASWLLKSQPVFPTGTINNVAVDSLGRKVLGGYFAAVGTTADIIGGGIRLNSDGSRDTSFNVGSGPNSDVYGSLILPDGKVILVGQFSKFNGKAYKNIVRLHSDGSVDTSFNIGTGFDGFFPKVIKRQIDGKILVAGDFTGFNGQVLNRLVRLNADGTLDTSFNIGTGFDQEVRGLVIQNDGKIVVGGAFTQYNGNPSPYIARLNSDGSFDSSYSVSVNQKLNGAVNCIGIQSDGKIIAAGAFTSWGAGGGATILNRIVRMTTGGDRDGTFNTVGGGGTGFDSTVNVMLVQPDDKVVLHGFFNTYIGNVTTRLVRLNADGTKDASFNIGSGYVGISNNIVQQTDGKLVFSASGSSTNYNSQTVQAAFRVNTNGSLDTTFSFGSVGFNAGMENVLVQLDGKILAFGTSTTFGGQPSVYLSRLNSNGTIDSTFTSYFNSVVNTGVLTLAVQTNDKILVGGSFSSYGADPVGYLMRLNTNGSRDTTFNTAGAGFNSSVNKILLLSNGKMYVSGGFTTYNGVSQKCLIKLNADGSKDTSFDVGTGCSGGTSPRIESIAVQSDEKVIIAGKFTNFNGHTLQQNLLRLNTDGSVDTSFNSGGAGVTFTALPGWGYASNAFIQPDGKIIVNGYFDTYNGVTNYYYVRLNSDGTQDTSFNFVNAAVSSPFSKKTFMQSDGKIVIAGSWHRLNEDGTQDSSTWQRVSGVSDFISVSNNEYFVAGGMGRDINTSEIVTSIGILKDRE